MAVRRDALDHRWTGPRLSPFVDGDLSPRAQRRVERHAGRCPDCGGVLRTLSILLARLRRLDAEPPPTLADDVLRRLDEEPPEPVAAGRH